MNFKIILLASILSLISETYEQTCNEAEFKKFDQNALLAFSIGSKGAKLPENNNQLKVWCKNSKERIEYIAQYNDKCNKNLFRQLIKMYIYAFKRTTKLYCKVGSKPANTLLEGATCFNSNKDKEVSCMEDLIDNLMRVKNEPNEKKLIPRVCCTFNVFVACFDERLTNSPKCNERKLDNMQNFIMSQLSDALNLICGDYKPDSDKCSKLGPLPKKKPNQIRPKSPILPAGQIFESIKEV